MARITEMGRSEAEENGNRTTVTAFVFKKIGTVFRTHLRTSYVTATTAHQLLWIVFVAHFGVTTCLASVVCLCGEKVYRFSEVDVMCEWMVGLPFGI